MSSREVEATPNLLPCPFCGGRAIKGMFNVWCHDCDAMTALDSSATSEQITAAWNTRVSANEARIKRLEEALRSITMIAGNLSDETLASCGGINEGRGRALMVLNARSIARAALQSEEARNGD